MSSDEGISSSSQSSTNSIVQRHSTESSISSNMDLADFMGLTNDIEAAGLPATQGKRSLVSNSNTPSGTTSSNNNQGAHCSRINYALPMNQRLGMILVDYVLVSFKCVCKLRNFLRK